MTSTISVRNLGKKYILSHKSPEQYTALRDVIANGVKSATRKLRHPFSEPVIDAAHEEFWALKDVSFDIQQGDRVGIIGRNGAGKSTLLKVLSRITEPTEGKVKIRGRVSSLLEVGTGFHPELSGRENIYLNGAILGMSKAEIKQKFDEIVAFAEVEKFLDTPVKRYSSGMYVRLAFAVAAHLEPEILIVDEVLAVGDAEFQKKCLGKMQDISTGGRTIIFVSHSMQTVTSLCNRCILLEKGQVQKQGTPSEVILDYLGGDSGYAGHVDFASQGKAVGDEYVQLLYGDVLDDSGKVGLEVDIRKPLNVRMGFRVKSCSEIRFIPNFHFVVPGGTYAFVSSPDELTELKPGDYEASCYIPGDFLNEGSYFVGLAITSYSPGLNIHFFEPSALKFNVRDSMEGSVGRHGYANVMPGVVRPRLKWTIKESQ